MPIFNATAFGEPPRKPWKSLAPQTGRSSTSKSVCRNLNRYTYKFNLLIINILTIYNLFPTTAPFKTLSLRTAADASPKKPDIPRWRRAAQGVKATVDLMNGLLRGDYFLYLGRHIL
jgi:hypothetical protein